MNKMNYREFWEQLWKETPERGRSIYSYDLALGSLNGRKVLDVGCGDSAYSPLPSLADYFVGVDISQTALRRARERHQGHRFAWASAQHLPFRPNSFDEVVSIETVSLLGSDFYKVLEEMVRVSRRGLTFTVSHEDIMLAKELSGVSYTSLECGTLFHHPKLPAVGFTENDIERILSKLGLKPEYIKSYIEGNVMDLVTPRIPIENPNYNTKSRIHVRGVKLI